MNVHTASVRAVDRDQAVTSVLLHKLSSDDAFRARFAAAPRDVLAELGVEPSADVPLTLDLPPKERFHAVLEEALRRDATPGTAPSIFMWVC